MARLQVDIEPDTKNLLRLYAVQNELTLSQVVEAALKEFLSKKQPRSK